MLICHDLSKLKYFFFLQPATINCCSKLNLGPQMFLFLNSQYHFIFALCMKKNLSIDYVSVIHEWKAVGHLCNTYASFWHNLLFIWFLSWFCKARTTCHKPPLQQYINRARSWETVFVQTALFWPFNRAFCRSSST